MIEYEVCHLSTMYFLYSSVERNIGPIKKSMPDLIAFEGGIVSYDRRSVRLQ